MKVQLLFLVAFGALTSGVRIVHAQEAISCSHVSVLGVNLNVILIMNSNQILPLWFPSIVLALMPVK